MIIAIEGVDAAGKASVSVKLASFLNAAGKSTKLIGFPRYDGPVGNVIKDFLCRELWIESANFGAPMPKETAQVLQSLMLADRLSAIDILNDPNIVICDRYYMSGIVYGIVEGLSEPWLYDMHKVLPKAKLQILLDIDPIVAAKRRGKPRDTNESNFDKLKKIREKYLEIWKTNAQNEPGTWFVINAAQSEELVFKDVINAWQEYCLIKSHRMSLYTEYP